MNVTSSHFHRPTAVPTPQVDPTVAQWRESVTPAPGEGDLVQLGRRSSEKPFASIDEVRERVKSLDFLPLDPYVATIGSAVNGEKIEIPPGEKSIEVSVPDFYGEGVEVLMGIHHGAGAPMMVILPGVYSSGESAHNNVFRKMALERGMNYVVIPNSLSDQMLEDKPHYHPGNPRAEAEATHQLLSKLKHVYPRFFEKVSVAGYSYGALHGANLVRFDEERGDNLINGNLAVVAPPEDLSHSMRQLDGLRDLYAEGAGNIAQTGLKYRNDVKKYGYEGFMESELASRGPGTNITEIKISDKYGSRDGLVKLIEKIDLQFEHKQLPKNTPEYEEASWWERYKMRQEHDRIVENITYDQMADGWLSKDRWYVERGLTPDKVGELYSFSEAIKAIEETPVLALISADDYILSPDDVQKLKTLETTSGELEVVRVMDRGGHVGLTWNPQVEETLSDFARSELP